MEAKTESAYALARENARPSWALRRMLACVTPTVGAKSAAVDGSASVPRPAASAVISLGHVESALVLSELPAHGKHQCHKGTDFGWTPLGREESITHRCSKKRKSTGE